MKKRKIKNWKQYAFEFLSIFIAVITAFALNNWNDNRRDSNSEYKILSEINNGLEKDLEDINLNIAGHKVGVSSCEYFSRAFLGKNVALDTLLYHFHFLTRDFISIQNTAGYETLKSKGLELIKNDSLRFELISLYEYDYSTLRKLEEEYYEMQFHENYSEFIIEKLAPNFHFDENGQIVGLNSPFFIEENERNKLLIYLQKLKSNRSFILGFYEDVEEKIYKVQKNIKSELIEG